jgi:hypothetical protein
MKLSHFAVAVGCATAAFVGLVHAQDTNPWDLKDRQAFYLDPAGKMRRITLSDTGHEVMMKETKPISSRTIVYRSGGKFFLMEDKKMPDGTMMFDRNSNWMLPGG